MFKVRYRYLFILLLAVYSYLNIQFTEGYRLFDGEIRGIYLFGALLATVFLVWEGNRLIEYLLEKRQSRKHLPIHFLIIFFFLSIINVALISVALTYLFDLALPESSRSFILHTKITMGFAFRVNLFLNSINGIVFFMNQYKKAQLETEQLKKQTLEAQFEALRSQINPHFLFNSLNVLSSLVYKDPEASTEFIHQLSRVYRYLLYYQERKLVQLREELQFLSSYLYLLRIRFRDTLVIEVNIGPEFLDRYVAPASLQLLIENAIKHNVVSQRYPLNIRLFINDGEYLVVENELREKQMKDHSTFTGLKNISRRYAFISNREISVTKDSERFRVELPLIQMAGI